jgi:hypothetical protein
LKTTEFIRNANLDVGGTLGGRESLKWSAVFAKKLRDDPKLRFYTLDSIAYLARKSDRKGYENWKNNKKAIFLNGQGATGFAMSSAVVEVAAFELRLDYRVVSGAGGKNEILMFDETMWRANLTADEALENAAKTRVEPLILRYANNAREEHEQAKVAVEDARDAQAPGQNQPAPAGTPSPGEVSSLALRRTMWERALDEFRVVQKRRTLIDAVCSLLRFADFELAQNSDPSLIACRNKVLCASLDEMTLRDGPTGQKITGGVIDVIAGMPEMWITQSTRFHYDGSYTWNHADVRSIMLWFEEMFYDYGNKADPETANSLVIFMLQDLSRGFYGANIEKKIRVYWGESGDNSKSTLIKMVVETYGDLADFCQSSIFVSRVKDGSSATPQLAKLAFIRWAFCGELDENDVFSGSLLKKVTSNDPFEARRLFREPFIVRPVTRFGIHSNEKPLIRTGGLVALRRFVIVRCDTRFAAGEPATLVERQEKRHYGADPNFESMMIPKKAAFLWMLKQMYPGKDFKEIAATEIQKEIYHREMDHYYMFRERELIVNDTSSGLPAALSHRELYDRFLIFFSTLTGVKQPPSVAEFIKGMINAKVNYHNNYFENVSYRDNQMQEVDDAEDYIIAADARFSGVLHTKWANDIRHQAQVRTEHKQKSTASNTTTAMRNGGDS